MARPTSQALGGFFATPIELLAPIARLFTVGAGEAFSVVDPCAADGESVIGIANGIFGEKALSAGHMRKVTIYACEMEATRYAALKQKQYHANGATLTATHGDALRLTWETKEKHGSDKQGCSLLYLNPPYDHDRECKRLEERFLRRFAPALCNDGVLAFVVPYNALSASADTIGRNFTDLRCYVFPESDSYQFAKGQVFKQVVIVGTKRPTLAEPDPAVRAQVLAWSESADHMPVLGSAHSVATIPGHAAYCTGFSRWAVAPLDVTGLLARVQPWHSTDRSRRCVPIPGVVPAPGDLLARRYPLAVPPKPAHLAAAIASGVFNGAEVMPDDPASKLPRLRVKGVFTKDFVTAKDKDGNPTDVKLNKEGEVTGIVQVQQPKLVITVLDVLAGAYHTLRDPKPDKDGGDPPATCAADMTSKDLLTQYPRALMAVMKEQCPVMHDPANDTDRFALPTFARPLYRAQEEVVRATVKLLGGPAVTATPSGVNKRGRVSIARVNRRGRAAFILGEIGSGKSGCALAVGATIGARRVLVMCPPHLLDGWTDQVKAVTPWAQVSVLTSVHDVDAFCTSSATGMQVAIVSREAAKLGHAYAGIDGPCPKCGSPLPVSKDGIRMTPDELAKNRTVCAAQRSEPSNEIARIADEIALTMMLVAPHSPDVNQRCRGRVRDRMMLRAASRIDKTYEGKGADVFKCDRAAYSKIKPRLMQLTERLALRMLVGDSHLEQPLIGMLAGLADDAFTASVVERMYGASCMADDGDVIRNWCRDALLLVSADRQPIADRLAAIGLSPRPTYHGGTSPWLAWQARSNADSDPENYRTGLSVKDGVRRWHKSRFGSPRCVVSVLALLAPLSARTEATACGEPLYQAIPEPRRVALATYLANRHPNAIDLLVGDELHEFSGDSSAQHFAFARLAGLGMPVVGLTGSVMNGYAESLFNNQWALDPAFREEFARNDRKAFVRRYGYIKVLVQETNKDGKVCAWGSQSDRRETVKEIGNAPGVLPLFTLRYLLAKAATLHKTDLALDLPPCREIVEFVQPDAEIKSRYDGMLRILKEQIKRDRFSKELAGKLFGMMSEIPSYLDRATCDTGNADGGGYEVRYPVNDELESMSGYVLASEDGLPASTVLPKERLMLEVIEREFKEGRRVMVFAWHEALLPRLQALVERELSEPCALLLAGKVQAAKRQGWIDREVVGKKRRVLVVNPVAVQTGLNNLIWFQSEWWHQNPACNATVYRQAVGRVDRIGARGGPQNETRIYIPVYDGTAQVLANKLTMHKVGVALATDGLNSESALAAAGIGVEPGAMDAMSVGRALFEMLERGEEQRHAETQRPANDVPVVAATVALPAPITAPLARSKRSAKVEQLDLLSLMAGKKVA